MNFTRHSDSIYKKFNVGVDVILDKVKLFIASIPASGVSIIDFDTYRNGDELVIEHTKKIECLILVIRNAVTGWKHGTVELCFKNLSNEEAEILVEEKLKEELKTKFPTFSYIITTK